MRLAMALSDQSFSREPEAPILPFAVGIAVALHVALAFFAPGAGACRSCDLKPPMEVELAPPPPPPPPPKPEPVAEKTPEPEPLKAAPPPKAAPPRAPAPAAAGKLLTAEPSVPQQEAPLDFVSDPNGGAYGFGVVARGGSKERVAGTAAPLPTTTTPSGGGTAPKGDGLAVAADLSEKPRLVNEDPCKGFYPGEASVDSAFAVVRVVVESDGRTRNVQLVSETPSGQGFGSAASRCLKSQRWSPAKDHDGKAVPTATTFRVRFTR